MLQDVPAWVLYMPTFEIISTVAYTLTFALLETAIVFLLVLAFGIILPRSWARAKYASLSSVLLLVATLVAVILQFSIRDTWPQGILLISILPIFGMAAIIAIRFPKIGETVLALAGRLTILTALYIFFDILGLLVVITRNV